MSVEHHTQASQREAEQAEEEIAKYDPMQQTSSTDCELDLVCWTVWSNPSEEHLKAAGKHRRLANKHREAAQALRDSEAEACEGVPERARDLSPFFYRDDIRQVDVPDQPGKPVVVHFQQVPEMTRERLATLIDCHLARNLSMGHAMPEMDYCPLVPKGVQAEVREESEGLAVELRVEDEVAQAELRERAVRLRER